MNYSFQRSAACAFTLGLVLCLSATTGLAQMNNARTIDKGKLHEATEESSKAAKTFREIMAVPLKAIPKELLDKAEAVAVFPNVIKAAFIFGGRGGDGVISRRTPTGWSAPVFFNMGGASFGPQIGAKSTDYVMLFMNHDALKGLLEDKFEFGGDVSFAAGPVGRTASASTNLTLDAGILSYSRSEGAFIGASLKGAVVSPDNNLNRAIYGKEAKELLTGSERMTLRQMPAYVRVFPQTLAQYSTRQVERTSRQSARMQYTARRNMQMQNASASREGGMTRTQAQLAREVRHELLTLPYYSVFDWLEFEVQPGGVVVLRGQVTTPPDTKSAAEAAAKDVEGVTRVINNIEVLPLSPNDQRLREALYRAVYSGPLFRYQVGSLQSIHIIVDNGRATLKGMVNSEGDKTLAYTQARTVPGLFEVNNELHIANANAR